jgi:hypothetical protein
MALLKICLGERSDGGIVLRYDGHGKKVYAVVPHHVWLELVNFIRGDKSNG